ncbi:MAG TPA: M48 family metallopeptidase [Casimicrobiaceae bacterium]|nr:M48 family metallopeptidase [Casimicrobiaceae bacterium]
MIELAGTRYDGRAPIGQPVRLAIDGDDVALIAPDSIVRYPRAMLDVDAAIPGVARRVRVPDGSVIELAASTSLEAIGAGCDRVARFGSYLESRWLATVLVASVAASIVWLVVAYLLPLAAEPAARSLRPEVERAIGVHALASIDRLVARPSALAKTERDRIAARVAAFLDGEPQLRDYKLEFRRMSGPNAFALPGNIVVVTDELVGFVQSDDELLAVIAHELGHLNGHHAVRLVLQQSGIAVLATVLAGDAVGMTFLAAAVPATLLDARYSRTFEAEADAYAFALLSRHGISPRVFADVMRRFASDRRTVSSSDPLFRYLSSHPATGERIESAEKAARDMTPSRQ